MDPNATLEALLDSIEGNERQEAKEYGQYLIEWLHNDGFLPKISRADLIFVVQKLIEKE